MSKIVIDTSKTPLVRICWPQNWDDQDLEIFQKELDETVSIGRCALLNDVRGTRIPSPSQRKKISESVNKSIDVDRRNVIGWADLSDSKLLVCVVTAIYWMVEETYPRKVFMSELEAEEWLYSKIR